MSQIYATLVTDVGKVLIAEALAQGEKLSITKAAVGDGAGAYYMPDSDMTALKKQTWIGDLHSVEIGESSNTIDVVAIVPSNVGGFTIREMAIFTDKGEMFAICNTPDTEKVLITSGAIGEMEIVMRIEVSNIDTIIFVMDPNIITATKRDVEKHNTSDHAHENLFGQAAEKTERNTNAIDELEEHIVEIRGEIENIDFSDIYSEIDKKVDKTEGKGLSTNDFTTVYKQQVDVNKQEITTLKGDKEPLIKNAPVKSALTDADTVTISDSAAANGTKRASFANLKSALKGYFDTLYNRYTHPNYTSRSTGFYKVAVDGLGHINTVGTVTKSDITALGLNASDVSALSDKKRNLSAADLNNPNYPEPYIASTTLGGNLGLPTAWWHLMYFRHQDNNGFGAQIAISLDGALGKVYVRSSSGTSWGSWKMLYSDGNITVSTAAPGYALAEGDQHQVY